MDQILWTPVVSEIMTSIPALLWTPVVSGIMTPVPVLLWTPMVPGLLTPMVPGLMTSVPVLLGTPRLWTSMRVGYVISFDKLWILWVGVYMIVYSTGGLYMVR